MGYLAPERVCGGSATVASDLYALGIVGYECLTGQPPFRGEPLQVALAHRDQDLPAFPPWCLRQPGGAELAALITDLTAKDPAARPVTAAEVAARACRIRDSLAGGTGLSAAPPPPHPSRPRLPPPRPSPAAAPSPAVTSAGLTREDGLIGSTWPSATPGPGPRRRIAAALGLAVGIAAAGLLGWQLAAAQDSPAQPRPVSSGRHPAGTPARSAASVRTVSVSASLAGRPAAVVRRGLQALGLVVEVRTATGRAGRAGDRAAALSHRPGPGGQRDPAHCGHPAATRHGTRPRPRHPGVPRAAGTCLPAMSSTARARLRATADHRLITSRAPLVHRVDTCRLVASAPTLRDDESVRCPSASSAPASSASAGGQRVRGRSVCERHFREDAWASRDFDPYARTGDQTRLAPGSPPRTGESE